MTHTKAIMTILDEVKTVGAHVSEGIKPFVFPGITVKGVSEIGFPVSRQQAKELMKVARRAPFGMGAHTVLDPTVRSGWEIDANQISFNNPEWTKFIKGILKDVQPELGIEDYKITANLYKLLIYEEGDFFVMHKDSEKEPGMFGTLVIALPSKHTGGGLVVAFDGQTKTIDFSASANNNKIPYAAFYADCDHEVQPITSGVRICLVYNLIQKSGGDKISLVQDTSCIQQIADLLKSLPQDDDQHLIKPILLGHQYSPSNFSMEALKLHDRSKADVLIRAAKQAGYYTKLGLVTHYQVGDLEVEGYNYSRYDDVEDGVMGGIIDEDVIVEYWLEDGLPTLDGIRFEKDELIYTLEWESGDPVEQESEGYTGNAGMTIEYWYHYGAVFVWPQAKQLKVLGQLSLVAQLEWIDYYNQQLSPETIDLVKQLIEDIFAKDVPVRSVSTRDVYGSIQYDYSPIGRFLVRLNDQRYVQQLIPRMIDSYFTKISVAVWGQLIAKYPNDFQDVFVTMMQENDLEYIDHLLSILNYLPNADYTVFIDATLAHLPLALKRFDLGGSATKDTVKSILQNCFTLSALKDITWTDDLVGICTQSPIMHKGYTHQVLIPLVFEWKNENYFAQSLTRICKLVLEDIVANKPSIPEDWSKPIAQAQDQKRYQHLWTLLTPFLTSPTEQVFDFKGIQAARSEMESMLRAHKVDVDQVTIKKGSPHTLRLTKNNAAYLASLAEWNKDVKLLAKFKKI